MGLVAEKGFLIDLSLFDYDHPVATLDEIRDHRLSRGQVEPSLHRRALGLSTVGRWRLGAGGRLAAQQTFDAHVLVDLRPFHGVAEGHDVPTLALLGRGVAEPRQPPQRRGDATAVLKDHDQLRLAASDGGDMPNRASLSITRSSHGRQIACSGTPSRKA